jgi:hypothetical protein
MIKIVFIIDKKINNNSIKLDKFEEIIVMNRGTPYINHSHYIE